jgi:transposase
MTMAALSGPERRRRWTSDQKYQIVLDSLAAGASVASVARDHGVHPTLIYAWRRLLRMGRLPASSEDGVDFVPVTIAPARRAVPVSMVPRDTAGSAIADARLEVVLRNGRMLRVPEGVAPSRAGALADALEGIGQ